MINVSASKGLGHLFRVLYIFQLLFKGFSESFLKNVK